MNPASYTGWTCRGGKVETVHHSLWLQGLESSLGFKVARLDFFREIPPKFEH